MGLKKTNVKQDWNELKSNYHICVHLYGASYNINVCVATFYSVQKEFISYYTKIRPKLTEATSFQCMHYVYDFSAIDIDRKKEKKILS